MQLPIRGQPVEAGCLCEPEKRPTASTGCGLIGTVVEVLMGNAADKMLTMESFSAILAVQVIYTTDFGDH
jgi:hypothetical protein